MSSIPQPLVAYQHSAATASSSGPKGSYGPVFAVLAVITVVAAIACVIGRLCARRLCQPKPAHVGRPHAERNVEHGFGMAKPAAAAAANAAAKKGASGNKIHEEIRGSCKGEKVHGASFGAKPSK